VPSPDRAAPLRARDGSKELLKAEATMGREFQSHEERIEDPTKHNLASLPISIAFQEFLDGSRFLASGEVTRLERAKDLIDGMQEHATDLATTMFVALNQSEVIIHVDIVGGEDATPRLHTCEKRIDARRSRDSGQRGGLGGRDGRCGRRRRGRGVGSGLQAMRRNRREGTKKAHVGDIGDRLGCHTEPRWRLDPSHGEAKW
jgi:hypothetical protein